MKKALNIGVIGLGQRGMQLIEPLLKMDDVKIVGVCDTYGDRVEQAAKSVRNACGNAPFQTADYNEIFRSLIQLPFQLFLKVLIILFFNRFHLSHVSSYPATF